MTKPKPSIPIFRVIKNERNPRDSKVIIQCSNCEKDIRPMSKTETLPVNRGIYCKDCDDGAIHLNMPKDAE